jgi:hypothetical protein
MKIPRDLSGHELVNAHCSHWGYAKVNQVGSHIILQTQGFSFGDGPQSLSSFKKCP